jgi:capsular polysaccharide biosynthesis protein
MTTGTQGRRTNGRATKTRPAVDRAAGGRVRTSTVAGRPTTGGPAVPDTDSAGPAPRRRLATAQWVRLAALALALILFGAVAGWTTAQVLPNRYAAHADVLYALSREQPTGFLREDRNITTQIVLLNSRSVLDPVAEEWGLSVQELSEAIDAAVVSSSEIISITLTDSDPDRAQQMLGTLVASYLNVSNNDPRAELRGYLDGQLTEVLSRISEVRANAEDRQGELAALVEREQWLRTQLDELQFSDIVGPGASVLVPPYVEATPVSPRPLVTTAAGALAGLVVAVFAVAVVARRMTRT